MTGTRRRQTLKNGAIIRKPKGRKIKRKNNVIKQRVCVCVCVERIEKRQTEEIEVYDARQRSLIESESVKRDGKKNEEE